MTRGTPSMAQWKMRLDAASRAARTFVQGLALDLAFAAGSWLTSAATDSHFAWSRAYWALQVGLLSKTLLQTGAAYLMRLKVPPKV